MPRVYFITTTIQPSCEDAEELHDGLPDNEAGQALRHALAAAFTHMDAGEMRPLTISVTVEREHA